MNLHTEIKQVPELFRNVTFEKLLKSDDPKIQRIIWALQISVAIKVIMGLGAMIALFATSIAGAFISIPMLLIVALDILLIQAIILGLHKNLAIAWVGAIMMASVLLFSMLFPIGGILLYLLTKKEMTDQYILVQ